MTDICRSDLTPTLKQALVILLEDESLERHSGFWIGMSSRRCHIVTILALYERYLVKIIGEGRYKRRHRVSDVSRMKFTAVLTDVGEYAARELQREHTGRPSPHKISEASARFIAEVVS